GARPLSYQWLRNGTNLIDSPRVSGATNRILVLDGLLSPDSGSYSVRVSNTLGSTNSAGALLTVLGPPIFQSSVQTNHVIQLIWSTVAGAKYQLQYKPTLNGGTWTNLGSALTATGSTLSVADPLGTNSQRFYRALLLLP